MSVHKKQVLHMCHRTRFEQLESRSMMASDVLCFHNIQMPEDADGSGDVTPLDALVVINQLNSIADASASSVDLMTDVDADASTSPLDALIVINYINRQSGSSASVDSTSTVPTSSRIARLEQAIASGTVARRFSLDEAIDTLATLRHGGRPELGDTVQDGILVHCIDSTLHDSTANYTVRLVDRLTKRLTEAGVATDIINTITTEISDAQTAGTPLTKTQIKARLTELGVDVTTLFPKKQLDSDRFLVKITDRLRAASVSEDIITTISTEITDATAAGTPLTLTQIKSRLTELGVDTSLLNLNPLQHRGRGRR